MSTSPAVQWTEQDAAHSAIWRSESGALPPKRVQIADDRITADAAYGLACQGTALLWRGDFQNARQLLLAMAHRSDRAALKTNRLTASSPAPSPAEAFHLYRQAQAQRARTLSALLVPLDHEYSISLSRAPDIRNACIEAYGPPTGSSLVPLRALLGLVGAHEWRMKGIAIAAIGDRIYPHYGVFAPIRREYIQLVNDATLPTSMTASSRAFDIGTGTGVLAAVLLRRGVGRVVATDLDQRAVTCARENLERLGLSAQAEVVSADLFPEGRAALVVCNPPWIPARPSSPIERGIYDPESRMLHGFLSTLLEHLEPQGEGWLVLSDLAEHLGLRTRAELVAAIDGAQLKVIDRTEVRPFHRKASDHSDALHRARAAEITSLWRLGAR